MRPTRATGFTLIEVLVALSILGVLTYGLMGALQISFGSQRTVGETAGENRTLRGFSKELTNEFRLSQEESVEIKTLPDGNHEVLFQLPIVVGAGTGWGVPGAYLEKALSADASNWSLRYTVEEVDVDGEVVRQLVRQVLDDTREVQSFEVVAQHLRDGLGSFPGFNVVQTGDVWNITLSMTGSAGRNVELHVAPRN